VRFWTREVGGRVLSDEMRIGSDLVKRVENGVDKSELIKM